MKYEQLAKDIIKNVGGKENVNSLTHCVTRLRFKLKDESKANTNVLKNMDGVVTVIQSGGQYQVVIGNNVPDVYADVVTVGGFTTTSKSDSNEKKNSLNKFIDTVSGVFTPAFGVLAASGMIKGFVSMFVSLGMMSDKSGTYSILYAIGDSLMYFFPIFLGCTASKKFKGNQFIGMAIGASLVYPKLTALTAMGAQVQPLYTIFNGTALQSNVIFNFLGIPVILMDYSSSVIPVILAAYLGAKIENGLKKIIPDVVKLFLVPCFTLLITVPLTFIVIGPIATLASKLIGVATLSIVSLSPILAGMFVGGLWQIFVIFGLHWGLIPITINNMMTLHYDTVLTGTLGASFAQTGVVLGILLKTKNKKLRSISLPAFISGIFGVTEPAIYGITLPRKKTFILSCIAAAAGGAITGFMGTKSYNMTGMGIFGIAGYMGPDGVDRGFYGAIISVLVSFILGLLLIIIFGFKDDENLEEEKTDISVLVNKEVILSPIKGNVKSLSEVEDNAFSKGALGKGIAIEPIEGKVISPVDGVLTTFFPTYHALGITSDNGAEILIHIGMDTVQLEGKHFIPKAKQGDTIKIGDALLEFDIKAIKAEGYSVITPVIITNFDSYLDVVETDKKDINYKEDLLTIMK